jgi:AraC family transcriptional regulator
MDDGPLSSARFAELLPTAPQASAEWSIFSLKVVEPVHHLAGTFVDHVVTLQESGRFRARQQVDGRSREGPCGAGCVGIVPANLPMKWDTHRNFGMGRSTSLFIPTAFISRVVIQEWDVEPRNVEIFWQFLARDPVIEGILTSLAVEAHTGSPSGKLYAESACEFLAHHVIRSYSSVSMQPRSRGGLSGSRLKAVLDYVEDNLAKEIALQQLAELAGVSPRHFERAFKQAVGMPPHSYVMGKRVEAARHHLIHKPSLSILEVAVRVGLSSSSHLAAVFRRHTGYSPSVFRRLHSRKAL